MKRNVLATIVLVMPLLAACAAQEAAPEDSFYRLEAPAPAARFAPPKLNGILEVERFIADGVTAGRPIAYSDAGHPHEVKEYHYHFWIQPPTVMLRDALVEFLRAANVAPAIVTPDNRVSSVYELTGKIVRMEKVTGGTPKGVLVLELALRQTDTDRLMFLRTYTAETAADSDSVADAVTALNRAFADICARFGADLSKI
ncbi:MAG: membrane integrity-associated transporter subunit PqiC [Hyphomicrobiales bacterium]|nr:membrane integrity-associated transporter subunit PqiC [Hyphomicrobiales bacterium]